MLKLLQRLAPYGLLALCLLPFTPGLQGPFQLDDTFNLYSARAPSGTWAEIYDAIFRNASGLLRRPIANLSFLINYHWIGQTPFHYKLVNLLLHGLTAVVLWHLGTRLLNLLYPNLGHRNARLCGLLAAAIWAVHPLQVSTALYAVQRMTQLSALFTALALLVCLRAFQGRDQVSPRQGLLAAIGAWALALLALFSKETGILFPALLMAIWLSLPDDSRRRFTADAGKRTLLALTGWLPVAAGLVLGVFLFKWFTAGFAGREFTLVERILTQPFVLAQYLQTILVPDYRQMGLYLDFIPVRDATDPLAWLALTLTLALPLLAWAWRKRAPVLCFAILWYYAGHALESTIFPLEMAFEHRNYLPLLGPALAVSYYLYRVTALSPLPILRLALAIPLMVLAMSTLLRAQQWSSPVRFVMGEANHHPDSARAQIGAASWDAERADIPSVIRRVKQVQSLRPDNYWPWMLDLSLACAIPGYPVQWQTMLAIVEKRPREKLVTETLRQSAHTYLDNSCPALPAAILDQHVAKIAAIYAREGMAGQLEQTLLVRSQLALAVKDEARFRTLLLQAAKANPTGTLALNTLAYHELNAGNLDAAQVAIQAMALRIGNGREKYRIEELRQYLRQARSEAAGREKAGVP